MNEKHSDCNCCKCCTKWMIMIALIVVFIEIIMIWASAQSVKDLSSICADTIRNLTAAGLGK